MKLRPLSISLLIIIAATFTNCAGAVDATTVPLISARSLARSIGHGRWVQEIRKNLGNGKWVPLIVYEGFQEELYLAQRAPHATRQIKDIGVTNLGDSLEWKNIKYSEPLPSALINSPDLLQQSSDFNKMSTNLKVELKSSNTVVIADRLLDTMGNKWYLNRSLAKSEIHPYAITGAIQLLRARYSLRSDSLELWIERFGDEKIGISHPATTVRELVYQIFTCAMENGVSPRYQIRPIPTGVELNAQLTSPSVVRDLKAWDVLGF